MSPTTSIPVFPISAVIAVTFLDSDPAGCTTLAASLSFISCFGLRCDCAELITFPTLGSAFDPSRYDTTRDRCMPSKPRFANPTGQLLRWIAPTYTAIDNVLSNPVYAGAYVCPRKMGQKSRSSQRGIANLHSEYAAKRINLGPQMQHGDRTEPEAVSHRLPCSYKAKQRSGPGPI